MVAGLLLSAEALCGFACATTAGTRPHAMSAEGHDAAAAEHSRTAASHEAVASPLAVDERSGCTARRLGIQVCWTRTRTTEDEHARQADEHRRIAAEHRAASAVLREAEAASCVGVAPEDRDLSPFAHADDIASIEPIYETIILNKVSSPRLLGVSVVFRPVPGLTRERLQQIVDCHLARNAALGHTSAAMPDCPLVPAGVRATVEAVSSGMAVQIRADAPETAREVLERAERLKKQQHAATFAPNGM